MTILTGEREHHISADIAYAVWQYWRATGDDAFMLAAGAEILVETARFWASRAQVEHDGRAHIRQVIGPDEYHEWSMTMRIQTRWRFSTLERAADAVDILKRSSRATGSGSIARLGLKEKGAAELACAGGAL